MTRLGTASRDIGAATVTARTERARREGVRRLLDCMDAMIEELEVLNLQEVARLDPGWMLRLCELVRCLPFVTEAPLGRALSPTEALDVLFDLQEGLLAFKNRRRGGWFEEID